MDIIELRAEIDTDPKALGYAGKTAAQIEALINAKTQDADIDAYTSEICLVLNKRDKMGPIAAAATGVIGAPSVSKATAAIALMCFLDHVPVILGTDSAAANALRRRLDELITEGLLVAADKTAVMGIVIKKESRAVLLGWNYVFASDIQAALNL